MKHIRIFLAAALSIFGFAATGCMEADPEFVHTDNTISDLYCVSATLSTQQVSGVIYEYDVDGDLMVDDYTFEDIQGGYGLIICTVPASQSDFIDITNCKLKANVGLDAFVTPALTGLHDISGDGIIVTVEQRSAGTSRSYRIRGEYAE